MKQPNLPSIQVCNECNWIEIQSLPLCLQSSERSVSPSVTVNFEEREAVQLCAAALRECKPCGRKGMGHESPSPARTKNTLKRDSQGESDVHPGKSVVGREAESWDCSACRRDDSGGRYLVGGSRGDGARTSQWYPVTGQEVQTTLCEIPF